MALAWGLQRTCGASASLMLALEASITAVLACCLYRETMGGQFWAAIACCFYLLAHRAFGAPRTGSVFAFAPFIGAAMGPGGTRALMRPMRITCIGP